MLAQGRGDSGAQSAANALAAKVGLATTPEINVGTSDGPISRAGSRSGPVDFAMGHWSIVIRRESTRWCPSNVPSSVQADYFTRHRRALAQWRLEWNRLGGATA